MDNIFLGTGLACIIAAIVGGGLKAFGIEVPVFQSNPRQIALGVLGVALVVVGLNPNFVSRTLGPRPHNSSGDVPASPPEVTAAAPTEATAVPATPSIVGPLQINVNADQLSVAPGGSTQINVFVTGGNDLPVPGARVKVSAGGGIFTDTGGTESVGQTDEKGVFRTTWRTYDASKYTGDMSYELGVKASKENLADAAGRITIFVHK